MVLGTANFGNHYKGVVLGRQDSFDILEAAWAYGIRAVETAHSYGESEAIIAQYIKDTGQHFKVYTKGRSVEDWQHSKELFGDDLYRWLWHWKVGDSEFACQEISCDGISCYGNEWQSLYGSSMRTVEIPWNIIDRSNASLVGSGLEVIARSIFMRGEAFKQQPIAGLPFWMWCLQDMPAFDDFIVGVDSVAQLSEIVKAPRNAKLVYGDPLDWVAK